MDKKNQPEYFELNPVYNGLKKDVLKRNSYQMNIDIFGDIQTVCQVLFAKFIWVFLAFVWQPSASEYIVSVHLSFSF